MPDLGCVSIMGCTVEAWTNGGQNLAVLPERSGKPRGQAGVRPLETALRVRARVDPSYPDD